jgi:hypothetical protein
MARYTVYEGLFKCNSCGANVRSLRSYPDLEKLTWMCHNKHLNEVSLKTKKSKRDYEREV